MSNHTVPRGYTTLRSHLRRVPIRTGEVSAGTCEDALEADTRALEDLCMASGLDIVFFEASARIRRPGQPAMSVAFPRSIVREYYASRRAH